MPPPALPTIPAGISIAGLRQVYETYPTTVTLVDGRPDPDAWVPTVTTVQWGYYQVIINGTDYTFFRDVPVEVSSYSYRVPLDDDVLELSFPQITAWEFLGAGALTDFLDLVNDEERVNVEVYLVDGSDVQHTIFEGWLASYSYNEVGTLEVTCSGALHQLDLYVRAPGISNEAFDIGALVAAQFDSASRPHLRTQEMVAPTTNIYSRYKGSWEAPTEFIRKLLGMAFDPIDSGRQWTVMMDNDRLPVMAKKADITGVPDYSVTFGARGVTVSLQRELLNAPNVIYGSGEDRGISWRNMFNTLVPFQPISYDEDMHVIDYNITTGELEDSGRIVDTTRMRIESHMEFGSGWSLSDATEVADIMRTAVVQDPGYVGTVVLNGVSPEETIGVAMKADRILRVRHLLGSGNGGFYLYISGVDVSGTTVTLHVDTKNRDFDLMSALRERRDVAAKNPLASLIVGRDSGLNVDSLLPWDKERSGWLPEGRRANSALRFNVTGGSWAVMPIRTAERVDIYRIECHFDQDVAYHLSIYDQDPTGFLPADPFAAPTGTPPVGPWTEPPDGFLVGWGSSDGKAGYHPHTEYGVDGLLTGATPTGDFVDEGGFTLHHDAAEDLLVWDASVHYVAIFVDDVGTFNGWMRMSPGKMTG